MERPEECSITTDECRYWVRLFPDNVVVVTREQKGQAAVVLGEGKLSSDEKVLQISHDLTERIAGWVDMVVGTLALQRRVKKERASRPAQAIAQRPTRPAAQPARPNQARPSSAKKGARGSR